MDREQARLVRELRLWLIEWERGKSSVLKNIAANIRKNPIRFLPLYQTDPRAVSLLICACALYSPKRARERRKDVAELHRKRLEIIKKAGELTAMIEAHDELAEVMTFQPAYRDLPEMLPQAMDLSKYRDCVGYQHHIAPIVKQFTESSYIQDFYWPSMAELLVTIDKDTKSKFELMNDSLSSRQGSIRDLLRPYIKGLKQLTPQLPTDAQLSNAINGVVGSEITTQGQIKKAREDIEKVQGDN